MNPMLGWGLAALLFVTSWLAYGFQGVAVAVTAVVFWLLLSFNRTVRVMKNAAGKPIGHVDSAVMLQSRLKPGMTLMQVVAITRSLGARADPAQSRYVWTDASAVSVHIEFDARGRLSGWQLVRPGDASSG